MSDEITKTMLARYPDMTSLNYAQLRGLIDEFLRERDEEWLAEIVRYSSGWWVETVPIEDLVSHMRQWAKGEE